MVNQISVGLHWPETGAQYRRDMPIVENCYIDQAPADFSLDQAIERVAAYDVTHPQSRVLLRIDFMQGRAYPNDEPEAREMLMYAAGLAPLERLQSMGRRLIVQCGNEPQNEGAATVDQVSASYNVFHDRVREIIPYALIASIPVAPYNADRLGAPATWTGDGSPWAQLHYALLAAALVGHRAPNVLSVHAYGDGDRLTVSSADGWRFAWDVLKTWGEVHADLHLDDVPVWISEMNTAARGITRPHRPADNYGQRDAASDARHGADPMPDGTVGDVVRRRRARRVGRIRAAARPGTARHEMPAGDQPAAVRPVHRSTSRRGWGRRWMRAGRGRGVAVALRPSRARIVSRSGIANPAVCYVCLAQTARPPQGLPIGWATVRVRNGGALVCPACTFLARRWPPKPAPSALWPAEPTRE